MRAYNPFLCPKCAHFEHRQTEEFASKRGASWKLYCRAGKKSVEISYDPASSGLKNPPPPCPDFRLEARRAR